MSNFKGTSKIIKAVNPEQYSKKETHKPVIDVEPENVKVSRNAKAILKDAKQQSKKYLHLAANKTGLTAQAQKLGVAITKGRAVSKAFDNTVKYIDNSIDYMINAPESEKKFTEVVTYTRGPAVFGAWVCAITLLISIIWGVLAPLDSAVHAGGQLVLDSKKRIISVIESGNINRIYVKNGDEVEEGEVLIRLDKTNATARRDQLLSKTLSLDAEYSRLIAERDDLPDIKFSPEVLLNANKPDISHVINTQIKLFKSKRKYLNKKIESEQQNIKFLNHRKAGQESTLEGLKKQSDIWNERYNSLLKLYERGSISKDSLKETERNSIEAASRVSKAESDIAEVAEQISMKEFDVESTTNHFLAETQKEMKQNRDGYAEASENLKSAEDQLRRTDIVSPISGEVSNIGHLSEGGSLHAGNPIMEIIPKDDKLVLEVRVSPQDIDVARVGQSVSVRLSAFKSRVVPAIDGTVVAISADTIPPRPGINELPSYLARIELDKKSLDKILTQNNIELWPGMQGDASIKVGTRTFLQYLLDPLTTSFRKAFIEQ